ncbi:5-formyltetrahydrofolate cyclo-ligase [Allonocardiopsis opalescens]|uniref:5-formyltetrahydrofolate cyclo-ligase n=1 Tax=Allonocardiopsis opalescens TaxID=1144618 RepID=UPI00147329F2|nr:5-formyltetrahydrofolate cyclo-ligase [Allonocardiopsis opalescens]
MGAESAAAKAALRRRMLAARQGLTEAERSFAGSALRDTLLERPELTMGGTLAAFSAMGTEPPTGRLLYGLWKRGAYVLLPVLLPGGDLDWAAYDGPDSLAPGPAGALEPTGPRYGVDAVRRVAAMIVPALAVDGAGRRLGRGGGSYDRALARMPAGALTIAAIYDGELVDEVPVEPHDRPVAAVVTPGGGFRRLG